jgi:hypothetical protein
MATATPETMRAAVLHGREDLRIESMPRPEPGPGELIVRVAVALTCGTDLKVFRRGYHAKMLTLNRLFGHELAGTVEAIGEGVTNFAAGDRVVPLNSAPCDACFFCRNGQQNLCDDLLFNNGAYAEFLRVPARIVAKNTLALPAAMPFEHAALTEQARPPSSSALAPSVCSSSTLPHSLACTSSRWSSARTRSPPPGTSAPSRSSASAMALTPSPPPARSRQQAAELTSSLRPSQHLKPGNGPCRWPAKADS